MFRNNHSVNRNLPTRENGSKHIRGNNSFHADRPCPVTLVETRSLHIYHDCNYNPNYKLYNTIKYDWQKIHTNVFKLFYQGD